MAVEPGAISTTPKENRPCKKLTLAGFPEQPTSFSLNATSLTILPILEDKTTFPDPLAAETD
jgi:hypothetical protein